MDFIVTPRRLAGSLSQCLSTPWHKWGSDRDFHFLVTRSTIEWNKSIVISNIDKYNPTRKSAGRRVITRSPENSETPVEALRNWITPNEQFYVLNHFDDPEIDRSTWKLDVTGWVEKDLQLSWERLDQMPQAGLVATLECAGNGRSFLEGKNPGVQWGAGAVGNAEWSGVAARTLLELARATVVCRIGEEQAVFVVVVLVGVAQETGLADRLDETLIDPRPCPRTSAVTAICCTSTSRNSAAFAGPAATGFQKSLRARLPIRVFNWSRGLHTAPAMDEAPSALQPGQQAGGGCHEQQGRNAGRERRQRRLYRRGERGEGRFRTPVDVEDQGNGQNRQHH